MALRNFFYNLSYFCYFLCFLNFPSRAFHRLTGINVVGRTNFYISQYVRTFLGFCYFPCFRLKTVHRLQFRHIVLEIAYTFWFL